MNFRIDLIDPSTGQKTGEYPLTSTTQVSRRLTLDKISAWDFDASPTDPAYADIEGKDFAVYWLRGDEAHYLGQCSYLDHSIQAGGDGPTARIQASGRLRDLTRQTVLQRSFDGATDDVNDVLSEIVPLRAGWTLGAVDTISNAAPMDFWYETIFDGVDLLAKTFGYHFREGSADKTLDFGAFGAAAGVLAVGGQRQLPPSVYGSNPNLCQISDMSVQYQSSQVVNQLVPFGGAVGVATIDLSEVTATQPGYTVQSAALPGGGSYYYIEDSASIAAYGLTSRRFLRKDLRPISNSPTAREYAANILYEATLASLLNLKDKQTIYSLSVTGLRPGLLRVGDKINVFYRGWVNTPTGERVWLDVDSSTQAGQGKAFYVLELNQTFGDDIATSLTINENAANEETVEDILANTIKAFELSQVHVQPTASRYTVGPYLKRVSNSPAVSATFSFNLGPETLDIWYIKMKLVGEPLKSSIKSIAGASTTTPSGGGATTPSGGSGTTPSGGGATSADEQIHGHAWVIDDDASASSGTPLYVKSGIVAANYGTDVNINTGASFAPHSHSTPAHTHSTPAHTHATPAHGHTFTPNISTTYGIFEDAVRPNTLTIKVNGSTVASGVTLAGPDYDYELDITANILAAASLQQDHTITVECGSNQGEIQFQAQVLAVIQPIQIN